MDGKPAHKKDGGKLTSVPSAPLSSSSQPMTDASKRRLVAQEIPDNDWSDVVAEKAIEDD